MSLETIQDVLKALPESLNNLIVNLLNQTFLIKISPMQFMPVKILISLPLTGKYKQDAEKILLDQFIYVVNHKNSDNQCVHFNGAYGLC